MKLQSHNPGYAHAGQHIVMLNHRRDWIRDARPAQLPPPGDWLVWFLVAGRGFGKTRTGAEWCGWDSWQHPNTYAAVVAPTLDAAREVCFEGRSGLLKTVPPECVRYYNRTTVEMELTNGTKMLAYSAEKPDTMRGPEFHRAWCDELGSWKPGLMQYSMDMLDMALRAGKMPRKVITSTPKPFPLLRQIIKDPNTFITRGSTYENRDNLAPSFLHSVLKYEGTTMGRQEIYGELINPEEMGVFKRSNFRLWRNEWRFPKFEYILQSWDCALTEKTRDDIEGKQDPTAWTTWGVFDVLTALPPDYQKRMLEMEKEAREKGVRRPYAIRSQYAVMLLDARSERMEFPSMLAQAHAEMKVRYGSPGKAMDLMLVEDNGFGRALRQVVNMQEDTIVPLRAYNPGKADKLARLNAVSHLPVNGLVWLPESGKRGRRGRPRDWCEPYLDEVCSFAGEGTTQHDDFVDSTSQALRFLELAGWLRVTLPKASEDANEHEIISKYHRNTEGLAAPPAGNPYDHGMGMNNPYVN